MTEDAVLAAISTMTAELSHLSGTVGELKTEVKQWKDLRVEARQDHQRCRDEVDEKFASHATEHEKLDERIKPIEELHQQQSGQRNGLSLAWRVVIAVMGSMVTVLTILAFFDVGG